MASFFPQPENETRQLIDSIAVFRRYLQAWERASNYRDGMYWKPVKGQEYLVRQLPGHSSRQKSLGARSEKTEAIFNAYAPARESARADLKTAGEALKEAERLNKALRVGRAPTILVDLLNTFEEVGIGHHFAVVGTNALYAYETASAVRIFQRALATKDIDLLWDARRKVSFVTDMQTTKSSMLSLLKRVDETFERDPLKLEAAVNAKGVEVEFLRREPVEGDDHPFQLTPTEGDVFVVPARRAAVLADARRFNHVVVSTTGRMALMRTIDPGIFVSFKRWLGAEAPGRDPMKKRRDLTQADIIEDLVRQGLLVPEASMDDLARVQGVRQGDVQPGIAK